MRLPSDPIIAEMLPDFVASWQHDVEHVLPGIIEERNSSELYRFGHTLRGSGRQFCADELSELGAQLQDASRNNDWDAAVNLGKEINSKLDDVKQFISSLGQSAASGNTPSNL
ncbi:MAG: Hpt domain-containing protein [Candidatus Kapabacteria bacterium]|nr:Hpt domain-containing protein [Candidatus Kapabacteria bacterium]